MPTMKKRKRIVIKGDKISREELIERLNRERISYLKFRMECIRTDDSLDDLQKSNRTSEIKWRLEQLQRGR